MHVRCPHCHNPIDLVGEESLGDVTCPSCGSSFNLIGGESTASYRAHEQGVIHRDLKPSNIMLDGQGVPHSRCSIRRRHGHGTHEAFDTLHGMAV